jgi:hypothetical protein
MIGESPTEFFYTRYSSIFTFNSVLMLQYRAQRSSLKKNSNPRIQLYAEDASNWQRSYMNSKENSVGWELQQVRGLGRWKLKNNYRNRRPGLQCREGESPCSCGNFSDIIALHAGLSNRIHLSTAQPVFRVWVTEDDEQRTAEKEWYTDLKRQDILMWYLRVLQLLSRNAVLCIIKWVLPFQKNTLHPSSRLKSLYPEDIDCRFFRKFGTCLPDYTEQ